MRSAATLDAPEGPRAHVLNDRGWPEYMPGSGRRQGGRRSVVLPPIKPRLSAQAELRKIIASVLAEFERNKGEFLASAAAARSELHQDMGFEEFMRRAREIADMLAEAARFMVSRLLKVENLRHGKKWIEQVNAAIGVDLSAVVGQADVASLIELATQRNVALIKGLSADVARRIEMALIDAITAGKSNAYMAKALDDAFQFGRKRAAVIARDQVAKFNGNLNRIRQQQVGVTEYIWWTVQDERVRGNPSGRYPNARLSHWDRHGKKFAYADPPSDGNPGEPIMCRCIARPVIRIKG